MTNSFLQNDLVHGWGIDFALRKCVEVIALPVSMIWSSLLRIVDVAAVKISSFFLLLPSIFMLDFDVTARA